MERISTLPGMISYRAKESAEKTAFSFQGRPVSYQSLWLQVQKFASILLKKKVGRQECVIVALPNGTDFFTAFYGIQLAGGIAVPLFPGSNAERIVSIAASCHARMVILREGSDQIREIEKHGLTPTFVTGLDDENVDIDFHLLEPDDIAFLQYTSGSTGNPKGVMLTHSNLLTNILQMIEGMQITDKDVFVSWLPVHHDMGLILMTMVPMFLGIETHLLPANLGHVRDWFKTIHASRATFTAAPDFAYRHCLKHIDILNSYDISSLRVALNAAEPVRASTVEKFESAFDLKNIVVAGYGLAEATVGVSMWPPGTKLRVDRKGFVSVGRPFPEIDVRIAADGEILIKSPANSNGYFNNPQATHNLFTDDGFIRSGDLGYLDDEGCLYITGRKKNIIKQAGETVSPQEIEETVDALAGVRLSAAVGIDRGRGEGEQLYIFAEVKDQGDIQIWGFELTIQIVRAVHARLGFRPARVLLVRKGTIPKTQNGKIQHVVLRERFLEGVMQREGRILYPVYATKPIQN